jgi:putative transposase
MILTYKYRIKDRSARKVLRRHAIGVNHVWNYLNGYQRDIEARYRAGAPQRGWPSHFALTYMVAGTSNELGVSAVSIGEVCRVYAKSRDANKGSLRFRSGFGSRRSLGWIPFRQLTVDGNCIAYLGKRYRFFGAKRRPVPDAIKNGAFVEDARGRWHVCFTVEMAALPTGAGTIGVDLGLKTPATLSSGETVPALQHRRRHEVALATAHRAGNKHRAKSIHAKIANARRDQMHKATTKIARENSLIVVGNVNAANLKKTRMAKSVSDAGWTMFRRMLEYKASRHQAIYVEADERFTSVTCSECGALSGPQGQKGLRIRQWECSNCGTSHDRDVNAARNILRVGQSTLPHADESRAYRISATTSTETTQGMQGRVA